MRISCLAFALAFAMFSQTACSPKDEEPLSQTYQMGERVPLGNLIYTVFERQWMTQIGAGVDARVPQNRFYLLRISAVNSGAAPQIMPTMSLVDDSGGSFSEIDNGEGVADFIGALREVPQAETLQGNIVFDVPQKHYKLKLTNEDGKQVALVELPLSFDSDAPDVTSPLNDLTKGTKK